MDLNFNFVYRHIEEGLKMVEEENIDRKLWPEVIAHGMMNDWKQCIRAERQKMSDMSLALVRKERVSALDKVTEAHNAARPTHYWACPCDACNQDVTREGRETDV